jgi:ABC-type phosphate transport system substrate-binding protein
MHPTTEDIQAAGHFASTRIARDLTIDVTNSEAKGAYPVVVVGYTIVRSDRRMKAQTRKTLRYFLSDAAQARLTGLSYAPLPESLRSRARAQLAAAR